MTRTLVAASAVVLLTISASQAAQTRTERDVTGIAPWCYRATEADPARCEFPSVGACLSIAGISGGACERNTTLGTVARPVRAVR